MSMWPRRSRHLLVLAGMTLFGGPRPALAQATFLLRDINPGSAASNPSSIVVMNQVGYFAASDPVNGNELWRSDGTSAGTYLVADIRPGSGSSMPLGLAVLGDRLYFRADDGTHGIELWSSDGTEAGTALVRDMSSGPSDSMPAQLTPAGTTLFLQACESSHGCELWRSDGTAGGTVMVKDINPGTASSSPWGLAAFGDGILFVGTTVASGSEPWRSDGTLAGTVMVKDINPGWASSGPGWAFPGAFLTSLDGKVYFAANDGVLGREMWATDGTSVGTALVADVNPGFGSSNPGPPAVVAGAIYFQAYEPVLGAELWRSDGTPGGSSRVIDLNPGAYSSYPQLLTQSGGSLFFRGGERFIYGDELRRTDGTAAGTICVKDIAPGYLSDGAPESLLDVDGTLFFTAVGAYAQGRELWKSDGTDAGTVLVADINPGSAASGISSFVRLGSRVIFAANDGTHGTELWIYTPNNPPTADAGPDLELAEGAQASLDASASSDPDSDPLAFEWRDEGGVVLGTDATLALDLPNGVHTLVLTVSDGEATATDMIRITVGNTRPIEVTVASFEGGEGSIGIDPPPGVCNGAVGASVTCTADAAFETMVTLTATPSGLSVFNGWSGACSGVLPSCTVTMSSARSVTATFRGPQTLTIEATSFEDGVGEVFASNGLDMNLACSGVAGATRSCTIPVRVGDSISFFAMPGSLSVLNSISGCVAEPFDPNGAGCFPPLTMTGPQTISATFRGPQTLTIEAMSFENGVGQVFASNGLGMSLDCQGTAGTTSTCTVPVRIGDWISFFAMPGSLSVLNSIAGCVADPLDPNGAGCFPPFAMAGPRTISATFRGPQTLTIEAVSFENGVGEVFASNGLGMSLTCQGVAGTTSTCTIPVRVGDSISASAIPGSLSVVSSFAGCPAAQFDPNGGSCFPPVPMTGPQTISATFRGPQTLTIEAASLENGVGEVFASNGLGMNLACQGVAGTTSTCTTPVRIGDSISIFAMPGPLSVLNSIAGCVADPFDANGAGCYPPFTMTGPKTVAATFQSFKTLALDLQSIENGQGTIFISPQTPEGECVLAQPALSASCSRAFPPGTTLTLTAGLTAPGSAFERWTGACSANGTNRTCQVVLLGDMAVGGLFHGPQTLTVTLGGTGSGTVHSPLAPCPSSSGSCAVPVPFGETSLLATPSANSDFQSWTGPCAGQGPICLLSVADDLAVGANFVLKNRPPVAYAAGPYFRGRNVAITFDGTGSYDPDANPLTYSWSFGDGTFGTGVAPSHSYATNGTFTVSLVVNDGILNSAVFTTAATITNTAPVAVVGGPYTAYLNQPKTFSGSGSSDANGDPLTYTWTFGAGQGGGTGMTPTKTFPVTGTFPVTLSVNDGTVSSPTAQTTVLVRPFNSLPVARPGGPYTGVLNQPVVFDGSASSDPFGDPLTYSWDFGDGTMGAGVAPSHSYATSGVFTVALRVSDGFHTTAYVATTAAISNRTPSAEAGGPYAGARGQAIPFTGAGADADGDTLTYFWDFGDGATATGPSVSHAYATLGSFTATLTTTDGIATSAPSTATVLIGNRAPEVSLDGPYSGVRQQAVSFAASGSDADGDAITYSWDFGDGATGTGSSVTHSYGTVGTFIVIVTANDGMDSSSPASAAVTISNQAPAANAGGPYSGVRNAAVTFSGAASSDADGDILTYEWAFGDGGTGTGVSPTHAYASTGTFTVTLMVNDGTTNSAPSTAAVTTSNQAPAANAGGPYSGVRNTSVTFAGAGSSDPDNDPLAYSWDFGDGAAAGAGPAPTHGYTTTGTFTVTLTVNDGTTDSTPATSTVTISNRAPIASPGGPYSGTRLAAIAFNGAASSDPDGDALTYAWTFGDGGTGTGATPTHLYTAVGTFTVTLTVNDGTTNSTPVATTVQIANVAPTVSLTTPAAGAVFHAPASVLVSASAIDSDGSVARVEFFAGGGKIGEALGAPYAITWSGATPGPYALTAVVTDSSGATATLAPVSVLLNAPPVVALTAPADNAQFAAPASITLTASASDPEGVIAQVEFFRGGTSLGADLTSPYSMTWSGAASGAYTLTAVATDHRGAVVASAPVTVKVTATLTPTADAYVRASKGNSNFGTATTVTVQQGSSNSNRRWTYMKFDLTSVPTITNAKVRVFGAVSATTSATVQTAVHAVSNTAWTETGLTWNNKPASGTTALATATIVSNSTTARWYELDVTAYLQAEKAAGRNVVTLAFKNLANSSPYVSLTSKEGAAANRPLVLVVP